MASAVVGNSSSGIIEVPTFGIPTVDIGARQKGRLAAESVIHCAADALSIEDALRRALTPEFAESCKKLSILMEQVILLSELSISSPALR